jgi:cytochrome b
MHQPAHAETVHVWDRFVRVFHWSLVFCVLANLFLVSDGETLHRWLGYTASGLVCMRIVWGFTGTRYARFSDFFPTPAKIRRHLQHMIAGKQEDYAGHNPVGAVMMLAMIAVVLGLGVSGYMQGMDAFWGEEWVMELHEALANTMIAFVGIHACAGIAMSFVERTNLVKAMITGVKVRSPRSK